MGTGDLPFRTSAVKYEYEIKMDFTFFEAKLFDKVTE